MSNTIGVKPNPTLAHLVSLPRHLSLPTWVKNWSAEPWAGRGADAAVGCRPLPEQDVNGTSEVAFHRDFSIVWHTRSGKNLA